MKNVAIAFILFPFFYLVTAQPVYRVTRSSNKDFFFPKQHCLHFILRCSDRRLGKREPGLLGFESPGFTVLQEEYLLSTRPDLEMHLRHA